LIMMYTAAFIPPEHNPVIDDHIIYAITLIVLAFLNAGDYIGFGRKWHNSGIVRSLPFLR